MSLPVRSAEGETFRTFGHRVAIGGYDRYQVRDPRGPLVAQVLVIPQSRLELTVQADRAALELDFRNCVTRPDLPGAEYRPRPGYYLSDVLRDLRGSDESAILVNGNNVGWWGNQFVIRGRRLVYKRKGPIFDDGLLHEYARGAHAFFSSAGTNGFRIANLTLNCRTRKVDDSWEIDLRPTGGLPRVGLSGFPLIRNGRPEWRQSAELAWDPGLLFDLGPLREEDPPTIRAVVRSLLDAGEQPVRHSMTVIGLGVDGDVVLLVAERSARSRGINLAEAADLLRRHFSVRDALVLGAAGDAQLATTAEGFLTAPLVAPYARAAARPIPPDQFCHGLGVDQAWARPVPCFVLLRLSNICRPPAAPPRLPDLRTSKPMGVS